ncbi:MAG: threonylcarbamoyl-AMP synthase [Sedimentisphaerales bacterium]|nr:threonylcarbamoyl-AMP synthase [Sedimentisphaerales bacterium]
MKTRVIQVDPEGPSSEAIQEACEILRRGGLVGFPTETVYGLAANADNPGGMRRLDRVKERPDNKPYTLHLPDKSLVTHYISDLSPANRQFIRKVWPGPVSIIFELDSSQMDRVRQELPGRQIDILYHNNSIGIRLPDNLTARRLLSGLEYPIVAPSANRAGAAPPASAEEVLSGLDGQIDLLLDAGRTRFGRASTVVKIAGGDLQILREGILDRGAIERMRQISFLFVCTGNSCRSPLAEGICRRLLSQKLGCSVDQLVEKGYKIESAGIMAFPGSPASPEAIEVCRRWQVDIGGHRARMLTVDMLRQADFVYVMDSSHMQAARDLLAAEGMAGESAPIEYLCRNGQIADPIGMPLQTYEQSAERIAACLQERLEEVAGRGGDSSAAGGK